MADAYGEQAITTDAGGFHAESGGGGSHGRMADSGHKFGWRRAESIESAWASVTNSCHMGKPSVQRLERPNNNDKSSEWVQSIVAKSSAVGGLANSISERGCSRESRNEDARDAGITGEADRPSGMVNTIEQGLQGQHRPADVELHGGEGSERSTGPTGFWDHYDIIPCRDGKQRRIECQSRRLADGIPALVDSVRDAGATEEQIEAAINPFPLVKKQLGRTILLKGYGNAIVPHVASEFIKAFLESQTTCSAVTAK